MDVVDCILAGWLELHPELVSVARVPTTAYGILLDFARSLRARRRA